MNFKFGVIYAKDGQITDDEMFSNSRLAFCSSFAFFVLINNSVFISVLAICVYPSV